MCCCMGRPQEDIEEFNGLRANRSRPPEEREVQRKLNKFQRAAWDTVPMCCCTGRRTLSPIIHWSGRGEPRKWNRTRGTHERLPFK